MAAPIVFLKQGATAGTPAAVSTPAAAAAAAAAQGIVTPVTSAPPPSIPVWTATAIGLAFGLPAGFYFLGKWWLGGLIGAGAGAIVDYVRGTASSPVAPGIAGEFGMEVDFDDTLGDVVAGEIGVPAPMRSLKG